jgi:hypothetical protein
VWSKEFDNLLFGGLKIRAEAFDHLNVLESRSSWHLHPFTKGFGYAKEKR